MKIKMKKLFILLIAEGFSISQFFAPTGLGAEEDALKAPPASSAAATASTPRSDQEWLCVSRLPRDMGEGELRALLADYGEVRHLRMVNSKISGRCSKTWAQCMMWSPLAVVSSS